MPFSFLLSNKNIKLPQDSIVSTERAAELERRKEIESQLDTFRKQQYEADHDPSNALSIIDPIIEDAIPTWAVSGRKKRRKKDRQMSSSGGAGAGASIGAGAVSSSTKLRKLSDGTRQKMDRGRESDVVGVGKTAVHTKKAPPGLTSYDDDEDDEDDDENDSENDGHGIDDSNGDNVVKAQNKAEKLRNDEVSRGSSEGKIENTSKGHKSDATLAKVAPAAVVKQTSGLGGLVSGYGSDSD